MARRGLPKKYAKMGFKRGWKAFRAAKSNKTKKSGAPAKKGVSSMPKKKATRKRRGGRIAATASRIRRRTRNVTSGFTMSGLQGMITLAGFAVGGGILTAFIARMFPVQDRKWLGLIQAGLGSTILFLPRTGRGMKAAALGAVVLGIAGTVREWYPDVPVMAGDTMGYGRTGMGYPRRYGLSGTPTPRQLIRKPSASTYAMGRPFVGARGANRYVPGGAFQTSANT